MSYFQGMIDRVKKRRKEDKERWELTWETGLCQLCGVQTPDIRSLRISCGYELKEISPKFFDLTEHYALRMCKGCRGALMMKLREWIDEKGRLADPHLDEDGLYGYTSEEYAKLKE